MPDQKIEPPTEKDIENIAMGVVHAGQVIEQALGEDIDGTRNDLALIQRLLDQGVVEPEATYTLQALGLAWIAGVSTPTTPYIDLVAPFAISGIGMALFWAPVANVVLGSVPVEAEGQASGANNAIRELGGVLGVAVLAAVFAHTGGYQSGQAFTDGMVPAVWIGAGIVLLGSLAAFAIKRRPARVEAKVAFELSA